MEMEMVMETEMANGDGDQMAMDGVESWTRAKVMELEMEERDQAVKSQESE